MFSYQSLCRLVAGRKDTVTAKDHYEKGPRKIRGPFCSFRKKHLKDHADLFLVILSAHNGSNDPCTLVHGLKAIHCFFRDLTGNNKDVSNAAVENLKHFGPCQAALFTKPMKDGLNIPGLELDFGDYRIGQHARYIVVESSTGDVDHSLHRQIAHDVAHDICINICGFKQDIPHCSLCSRQNVIGTEPALFKQFPDQRKSIGMYTGRGKSNQDISHANPRAIHDSGIIGDSYTESGDIIFSITIHVGHFCRFTTQQRATGLFAAVCYARNDLSRPVDIKLSSGKIIKKKKRTRPLDKNIIGTHGHKINTYRIMSVKGKREFELCAHAVSRGDKYRFTHSGKIRFEQTAKPSDIGQNTMDMRFRNNGFDARNKGIAGVDVYSGVGIRLGTRQGHDPLLKLADVSSLWTIGFSGLFRKGQALRHPFSEDLLERHAEHIFCTSHAEISKRIKTMSDEKPFAAENPFRKLDRKQFLTAQEKRERQNAASKTGRAVRTGDETTVRSFYEEFGSPATETDSRTFLAAVSGVARLGQKKHPEQKAGKKSTGLENPVLPPGAQTKQEGSQTLQYSRQKTSPSPVPADERQEGMDEFAIAMKGVAPLSGKGREVSPEIPLSPLPQSHEANPMQDFMEGRLEFALAFTNEYVEGHVIGLDLMTVGKLQAGQFSPEAHLDLHGMTAQQAFDALVGFFRAAYFKGHRTVLVVPGRGKNSPHGFSILREKVQDWFTQEPFRRVILAFCTAKPSDGGAGALYVLLRKFRKGQGKVYWDRRPADPDLV